jgi:tetratricopeptide (TPR) repeat protein
MKRTLNIFILLILVLQTTIAANIDTIFSRANQEYANEMYANAIEDYHLILQTGYESDELYFNLGNAYFKANDIPSAILYYEKAKKLRPNDDDINFNLSVANTQIVDKIEPVPELFLKQWWRSMYNIFSTDTWTIISVVGFILFFILLAFYLLSKYIVIRKAAFYAGMIVLFLTLITFILAFQKYNIQKYQTEAIVFTPTITVKSSPNQNSVDLFVIHEGAKVKILERVGNWCEIKIANGSVGWLPADAIKDI